MFLRGILFLDAIPFIPQEEVKTKHENNRLDITDNFNICLRRYRRNNIHCSGRYVSSGSAYSSNPRIINFAPFGYKQCRGIPERKFSRRETLSARPEAPTSPLYCCEASEINLHSNQAWASIRSDLTRLIDICTLHKDVPLNSLVPSRTDLFLLVLEIISTVLKWFLRRSWI